MPHVRALAKTNSWADSYRMHAPLSALASSLGAANERAAFAAAVASQLAAPEFAASAASGLGLPSVTVVTATLVSEAGTRGPTRAPVPPPTDELRMLRANSWQWTAFEDSKGRIEVERPARRRTSGVTLTMPAQPARPDLQPHERSLQSNNRDDAGTSGWP